MVTTMATRWKKENGYLVSPLARKFLRNPVSKMAGSVVFAPLFGLKGRLNFPTDCLSHRAACVKTTSARDIDRTGQVTRENDALPLALHHRIRDRDSREQHARIGMFGSRVQLVAIRNFDNFPKIHHRNTIRDVS